MKLEDLLGPIHDDDPGDPRYHMRQDGRTYLTPEDIGAAWLAQGIPEIIRRVALGYADNCEDYSCCAHVALFGPAPDNDT